jgi:hypothetical protein
MIVYFDRKRALKRHPNGWEFLFPKAKSWSLFADVLLADTSSSIEVAASADLSEMLSLAWAASLYAKSRPHLDLSPRLMFLISQYPT